MTLYTITAGRPGHALDVVGHRRTISDALRIGRLYVEYCLPGGIYRVHDESGLEVPAGELSFHAGHRPPLCPQGRSVTS